MSNNYKIECSREIIIDCIELSFDIIYKAISNIVPNLFAF